jgi:hypothetical protein
MVWEDTDACKEYHKNYSKVYNEIHKEENKARGKAYYEANKKKILARQNAYNKANKEKIAAREKAYRDANPEKEKARSKAYSETHKDELKAYRGANKDKIKAYLKNYHETHLEKSKVYQETHKEQRREYYQKNKEKINAQNNANYKINKEEINKRHKEYIVSHKKDIICIVCGGPGKSINNGKFCSDLCQGKWYSGPKASKWNGGVTYRPYCPKFTESLKEEIRTKFDRRCFLSGNKENGRKLAVHHCDYLKSQGCRGQRWSLLPLDHSWHSKTNGKRWYWFALLRDYWVYKYLTFHGMDIFEGPDRTAWLWEMHEGL